MNKKLFILIPAMLLLVGCRANKQNDSKSSDSSSSSESTSSESSSSSSSEYQTSELTVRFNGESTRTNMGAGAQLSTSNVESTFTTYMNSQGVSDFYKGYEQTSCAWQLRGDSGETSLTIGSGSSAGSLKMNFNYQITKIEMEIQAYGKWISYSSTWSIDTASELTVEDVHYDLSVTDTTVCPENKTEQLLFDNPINSLTFSNSDAAHRAYVNRITFTYITK